MFMMRRSAQQRGQASLIGLLVSLTIIAILSAWYYNKILKPKAGSHNGAPAAEQSAYGSVCSVYQSQLNQAVMMYKQDHNDRSPASFEPLKKYGATDDIVRAQGCQFQLDAATGNVTDIGHGMAAPNAAPIVINSTPATAGAPSAPGPYWQKPSAAPAGAPGTPPQTAPMRGPGGITMPPSSSTLPADTGSADGSQ